MNSSDSEGAKIARDAQPHQISFIYCTLLRDRIIAPCKDVEGNELWLRKFGPFMRFGGPFLIDYGLAQLVGLK